MRSADRIRVVQHGPSSVRDTSVPVGLIGAVGEGLSGDPRVLLRAATSSTTPPESPSSTRLGSIARIAATTAFDCRSSARDRVVERTMRT